MLYHFLYPLAEQFGGFNVVRYITFRTAAATLTALFISFLMGPWLIRKLAALRVGQPIREIGPAHQAKAGTPTMGGLLILVSLAVSVLLWAELDSAFVWIVLGLTIGYAVLGFVDDYHKVTKRHSGGISARPKLFWQTLLAFGAAFAIYTSPAFDQELSVPFFKNLPLLLRGRSPTPLLSVSSEEGILWQPSIRQEWLGKWVISQLEEGHPLS